MVMLVSDDGTLGQNKKGNKTPGRLQEDLLLQVPAFAETKNFN